MGDLVYSTKGMSREMTFILYKGELYSSDFNHQDCVLQILKKFNTSYKEQYGFEYDNDEYSDNIDMACDVTYDLKHTDGNDIVAMDLFSDLSNNLYLVVTFKSDAEKYMGVLKYLAESNGYKLGYFTSNSTFILF